MADEDMAEAEDVQAPIVHGVIKTDGFMKQDDVPNIEYQAAETLALPEVSNLRQRLFAAVQPVLGTCFKMAVGNIAHDLHGHLGWLDIS